MNRKKEKGLTKMKKAMKSGLALFLVFIMVFGGAPLGALAGLTEWLGGLSVTADAAHTWAVGDIGTFGSYPQTRVTDGALLSALNAQPLDWVSYGYYISGSQSDYMKYADVTYGGNKYRAVKFTSYRPYYTTDSSSASSTYQDENGYFTGTAYWFKYEPLRWRVLSTSGLLMCESIIDSQHFYPTNTYPTWANSSIRTWINDLFYNTAFTSTEQSNISSSTVSTPDYNGNDGGADTTDKLFLLSREEVTTTAYGFSSSYSSYDTARRAQGSDYAKCQGLWVDSSAGEYYGNSNWRLRSPGHYSYNASYVDSNGYVDGYYVFHTGIGVRPAFKISNLSSLIFTSSEAVAVTGVSLGAEGLSLTAGETAPLVASVEPSDATDKSAAWTSSNTSVATVSQSGIVTAVNPGTATITVTANDTTNGILRDTCAVTVSAAHTWAVGDIGTFGSYPQTRVTDSGLLTSLNALTPTWVSYGYYISGSQSDYMKYADVTYGGNKYRAVKFTSYRPYYTDFSSSASNTYQDENGYFTGTAYWFKYEPLRWRVLDPATGLVMCETLIDSQAYSNTIYGSNPYYNNSAKTVYANDYATSSMRTWLNGLFLQTAFTGAQQSDITTTALDNSAVPGYSQYNSASTNDKLFLLSYSDSINTAYGFSSSTSTYDTARRAQGSDYAKCQGLYVYSSQNEYYGNSNWFLRSPGYDSRRASRVRDYGDVYSDYLVDGTDVGVRPAFKISNLSSLIFTSSEAVAVTGVSLGAEGLSLTAGETAPLVASVEPSDATDKSAAWTSSNTSVATVSQSGIVTAVAEGTATITVTTTDGGFTDTCDVTVSAPHTHDYTYITHRVEPTCTEDGYIQHICSCGACYFTVLETAGHTWTLKSSTAATCTQAGVNVYECSVCGEIKTETVPAKGHNFPADGAPYTEPTCTQDGYWTLTCADCGETQVVRDEGSAAGHSYGEGVITVAPTCTTAGEIRYTCTKCGNSYTETLPAAHTAMNDGVVTTEPTCTQDGVRTFTCADCGESYTEAIPALGHDYVYADNHNGTHTVTCSRCGYTLTEAHRLNGRKCVCGYVDDTCISVLLVQDSAPWATSTNENTLNSLVNNGYIDSWDTCKTSGLANTDLADYSVVMLANDQDTATYTTYKESNEKIADYVENGGCLLLGVCDHGWDGGEFGTTLIAGVQKGNYYDWNNSIVDFDHPIVTGELTDGKTLTDSDLRSTYCSHTYFVGSSFPEGTNVIFQDSNDRATLIEYPYGDGNVIASGLTWEYSMYRCDYAYFSPYAFDDLIVYAVSLSGYGEARLTVRFEDWDGDVLKTQRVAYGEDAAAPANPARTGYTFTGWSGSFESIVQNTVVTAEYSINSYTVTLLFDDAKGTASGGGTFEYGEKTALSATPADNYEFIGWYIGNTLLSNSENYVYTVSGNKEITARFEADIPTLTKIEINTEPDKTEYFTGEYLDKTGLTIKATYSDDSTAIIGKDFTCAPTHFTSSGTKTVTVTYEGKTDTFDVTVTDIALTKIEVLTMPIKTSYVVGDTLDTTGLTLTATYNNGTTQTISSGFTCDPTALNAAGTITITVTYGGKSCTFEVTVTAVALTKIEVKTLPNKTSYYVGDTLDTTGLTLTATFSNSTTSTITSGFTCSPTVLNTAGTQTITVTYGGETCTFDVTVAAVELVSIAVKDMPYKTNYFVGNWLVTTGLTLTATYSDDTTATISSGFTCDPTELNTVGTQTITVTYGGKSDTFEVTVTAVALTKIDINTEPYKTDYFVGDTLDTEGLTLTATYNNGAKLTISSGFTCTPMLLNTAGTQTITVTYGGKTCTFEVTVTAVALTKIDIKTEPDKTDYFVGDTLDTAGLTLTATYNNGTTKTISSDFTCDPTVLNTAGTQTITVTYGGKSDTFEVTVSRINASGLVIAAIPDQTYTGLEIKPFLTVKYNGVPLSPVTEYTVAYTENINAGTATVTVTGIGRYSGTKTATFKILPRSIAYAIAELIPDQEYTGSEITPEAALYDNGKTLVSGTDYTTAYADNIAVGTAKITLTGKGNYTGTKTVYFQIVRTVEPTFTVADIANQKYTGFGINPAVKAYSKADNSRLTNTIDYTANYRNNILPGTATAVVTGRGSHSGVVDKDFGIIRESITAATVEAIPDMTETGGALTPIPVLTYKGRQLVLGVDFTAEYANNVNPGTATVTITGIGGFEGTTETTFTIVENTADFSVDALPDEVYTGGALTPTVIVRDGLTVLEINVDYTVSYTYNINVGYAVVTITGMGAYGGTFTVVFCILSASIESASVPTIPNAVFNNSEITPDFGDMTITYGGVTLEINVDFKVEIYNNYDVGTATIILIGIGNFSGMIQITFNITAASASGFDVGEIADTTYTGGAITPAISVSFGGVVLRINIDYTVTYTSNINAGTATVTITGIGNFTGTKPATFTINAANASGFTVTAIPNQIYTGSAITPAISVSFGGVVLRINIDYTVTYTNNINAGTATVIITGIGNFEGTTTATFTIGKADAGGFDVEAIPDRTYTGGAITPTVVVSFGGIVLRINIDYTVTYTNNVNAGTATVTVTGEGNFEGTTTATFIIGKANASLFVVTAIPDQTYTGSAITPTVIVKFNGATLALGTDYTVSYSSNISAGTATVTITGKGNFTGTKTATFKIVSPDIAVTGITLSSTALSLQYKGTSKLTVMVSPANATNKKVTWRSDNEKVATVDANGNVTAKGTGTATITATSEDGGHKASCSVTVAYVWWQWLIKILLFGWIWY